MELPVQSNRSLPTLLRRLASVVAFAIVLSAPTCPPWYARIHPGPVASSEESAFLKQPHSITQSVTRTSLIRPQGSAQGPSTEPVLAPFFGNLTTVTSAPADNVGLLRQPDCSLTYYDFGLSSSLAAIDLTSNSQISGYEKTIHSNAFLTTTPDVFAGGCVDNTVGSEAEKFLGLGTDRKSVV